MIDKITVLFAQLGDPESLNIPRNNLNAAQFGDILGVVYFAGGVVAVIALIVGGFYYASSNGDSGRVTKGKNIIVYSVAGIIVIGFAFAITQFIIGRVQG